MPILINFFRFAAGGLMRLAPLLFTAFSGLIKGFQTNKFLSKYGVYIVGGLVLLYVMYTREEKKILETVKGDPERKAALLGRYFGTTKGLSWWQPTTWYEDEDSAFELLMNSIKEFSQISKFYNKNITDGRDLRRDIEKFLTVKQIDEFYGALK